MSVTLQGPRTELAAWQSKIEAAWQKSVASVIEVGQLVKKAKEALGVSYSLLETELPFSATVAAFLIKIADNPVLSDPAYQSRLPNGYNTLYQLAQLDEKTLVHQLENGKITPDTTLAVAKSWRASTPETKPKVMPFDETPAASAPNAILEVGSLFITTPNSFDKFEQDLKAFLQRYQGSIVYAHKPDSIAAIHKQQLLAKALQQIAQMESQLNKVTLEELRILEDVAFFLSKSRNQGFKAEIVLNGELVERTALPRDHKDYDRISRLIGSDVVCRGTIRLWCRANQVPCQFVDLKDINKELYVWEQVRLVLQNKDVKGAMRRIKSLVTHGRIPEIKALATHVFGELNRFQNGAS